MAKKKKAAKPASKKTKAVKKPRKSKSEKPEPVIPEGLPELVPSAPKTPGGKLVHVKWIKGNSPEIVIHEHLAFLKSLGGRDVKADAVTVNKVRNRPAMPPAPAKTTAGTDEPKREKTNNPKFHTSHDRTETDK